VEVPPRQTEECEVALSNGATEILSLQAQLVALYQGHVKSQQIPVKVDENTSIHLLERKFNDAGKMPSPVFPYHICIARILLLLLLLLLLYGLRRNQVP
jgi:hypothetical protein